ncbi:MAG: hypothetical protein Q4C96_02260 [Planctomycetia bacterium]|nr:hypothetical protein [Planctomycetia bacterium]
MFTLKNNRLLLVLFTLMMAGCQCMEPYRYEEVSSEGFSEPVSQYVADEPWGGNAYAPRQGCARHQRPVMPPYDRPFPLGQVTDAHTDTQETNAEAAKFILYDHEFRETKEKNGVVTTMLTPDGKKHLMQIAIRLSQVPFPVVVEESDDLAVNELRRTNVVRWLCAFHQLEENDPQREVIMGRVVIAPALENGLSAEEAVSGLMSSGMNSYSGQVY